MINSRTDNIDLSNTSLRECADLKLSSENKITMITEINENNLA